MVDLRKGGGWSGGGGSRGSGGSGGPFLPIIVALVVVLGAMMWTFNLFYADREDEPVRETAPRAAVAAVAPPAPNQALPPADGSWTRLEWYWKYDPKKEDRYLTRVVDQYGCAWWMEIGATVSGYKTRTLSSYRTRAMRADGIPDCPKSEMPKPKVAYLTDAELEDADVDDMTIVSRTKVKAGDPGLVRYYRERRDEAARAAQSRY